MSYYNRPTPRTMGLRTSPIQSDLSGILDDIINGVKSAGKAALNFYGSAQQAQGAQQAYQNMTPATTYPPASGGGGISTTTLLLLGGGAVGLYFLLKK